MIKPIETWTETFAKLGRRVRRIWHSGIWDSGQQPNHEYRFDGFEQLEERQMLSGTGGDDLGGGGTTDGGAADNGGYGGASLPPTFSGIGEFANGISIPGHWKSVLPAGYSWGSANIFTYQPTAEGTYTFTSFTSDADDESDTDSNSVVVSKYTFTITVDWQDNVYTEVVDGHLSQYIIATDDTAVRDSAFSDGFSFGSFGYINFESDLDYTFKQTYSQSLLVGVDVTINESNDTIYNWTAFNYKHLEPDSVSSYTSDATFSVAGASHGNSFGQFQATLSGTSVSFETNGSGSSKSGSRGAAEPEFITQTYSGTTTVESGDVDTGAEGKRETLTLNGTAKNKFSSSYSFDGNGTISNQSGTNRATGQITKTGSGSTHFVNNLESTFDSKEVLINVAFLGMEGAETETGLFTSGSGFYVNLADDDEIRNTNTTEVHSHKIDHSSGNSSFNENWTINHLGDGRTQTSPDASKTPSEMGLHVNSNTTVDVEEDSSTTTSVKTNNGAGFTSKSIRIENDSHTTGTINASISNQLSDTTPTPGDTSGLLIRVGTIENSSDEDLDTTGTSKQTITLESLQRVTLGGGPMLLERSSGTDSGSGGTAGDGGTDGGDGGNLQGSGGGTDGDLPTPGGAGFADFNDYRKNIVVINLKTLEEIDDHLNVKQTFESNGVITLVDNSNGSSKTTYQEGSFIESTEDRNHTPNATSNENLVINQGVTSTSHSYNRKDITGDLDRSYTNTALTSVLTPVDENAESSTSDGGDVNASTGSLSNDSSQQYDVSTTGSVEESVSGNLAGTLSGNGTSSVSHWINEGSGENAVHKTIKTSGSWNLSASSSSSSGNRTTTTVFQENGGQTITYTGSSSESLNTTKTITSSSSRGESSGQLPGGMPDPHSDGPMTDAEMDWVNDTWMFDPSDYDFNFADDSSDSTTINNERDKFDGSFSFEKSTESATVEVKTNTFSGSVYNYVVTLTPKAETESSGNGGSELSEPTVTTGNDTTQEISSFRDQYDVQMSGSLTEMDLADIQNKTTSSKTQTVKLSQTQGLHPGSEDYWLGQMANGLLPEWANRHMVRTGMVDTSITTEQIVRSLVLDSQSTTFNADGAVTTTSIELPPKPNSSIGDDPMGGGSAGGTEPPHPLQQFSGDITHFYDAYDGMIGSFGGVAQEINGKLNGSGSGTSGGPGGPSGPGGDAGGNSTPTASGTPYTLVTDTRTIDHRQQVQELLFMDDISMGQGYFSVTDYQMLPSEGKSYSEKHAGNRIIYRDLSTSRSVDQYLDEMETPDPADSPETGVDATSGSSTQTADSGSSDTYTGSTSGSITGTFQVIADTSKETDYKWTQTEKIHSVTIAGVRTQTSQTKFADYSRNKDLSLTDTNSEFLSNGDVKFSKTDASDKSRKWKVGSTGKAKTRSLISDTNLTFNSENLGNTSETQTQSKSYTKQRNVLEYYPTFSGKKIATANVDGDVYQTTKATYHIPNPVPYTNYALSQETFIHIEESANGAPVFDLVGMNMFQKTSGSMIQFNHTETGHTTIDFSMLGPATVPYNGPTISKEWGSLVYIGEFETYTYGDLGKDVQYFAIATTVGTRLMGVVTLVGGIAEVAGGVALTTTGAGTFFGVVAVVHGIDTIYAGSTQLLSGAETRTFTAQLATSAFISGVAFFTGGRMETEAELAGAKSFGDAVDVLVGLADMAAAGVKAVGRLAKAAKAADTATGLRTAANAADNLDEVGRLQKGASDCLGGNCFIAGVPVAAIRPSESGGVLLAESPTLWLPEDDNQRSALWTVEVAAVGGVILATIGMLKQQGTKSKTNAKPSRSSTNQSRDETDFAPGQLVYC